MIEHRCLQLTGGFTLASDLQPVLVDSSPVLLIFADIVKQIDFLLKQKPLKPVHIACVNAPLRHLQDLCHVLFSEAAEKDLSDRCRPQTS